MGAWSYIAPIIYDVFKIHPAYAGRDTSASPAVGTLAIHKSELETFLQHAFSKQLDACKKI